MYFSKAVIATVIATGSVLGAPVDSTHTSICDGPCDPIYTPEPCVEGCEEPIPCVDGCDDPKPCVDNCEEPKPCLDNCEKPDPCVDGCEITPPCEGWCENESHPDDLYSLPYFQPCATWHYNVKNGAISAASTGLISKSTNNAGADITTLVTFQYPEAARGMKCQFAFYFDATASASGSRKMDLFTTSGVAPGPTTGWGPGNRRDCHLGRLDACPSGLTGFATREAKYNAYLTEPTDCKAPGTEEGFELVGVYDEDYIWWDPSTNAGPRIIIS